MSNANWTTVSRRNPCPVCHKPDWCTVSNDGEMCVCRRVESSRPAKSGMGWIHVLKERPAREYVPRSVPVRPKPQLFDAESAIRSYRAEFTPSALPRFAGELGLPQDAVARLRPGKSAFYGAWAFPMLDGEGNCVGIRLRAFGGSKKWSVAGSRDGLFYDPALQPREAVCNGLKGLEIVVVEGASDCAAGYALELPAVGRSSCNTGGEHLKNLCKRLGVSRVTVVADNDTPKSRPDKAEWMPGLEGARRLAASLGRTYRIVVPPRKDLREWFAAGLTPEAFWRVAGLQRWRVK